MNASDLGCCPFSAEDSTTLRCSLNNEEMASFDHREEEGIFLELNKVIHSMTILEALVL